MLIRVGWLSLAFVLALAQFQLILVLYQGGISNSLLAARGVFEGTPHWVIYQSRILGPYLIEFIRLFVDAPLKSYLIFFVGTQTLSGYLMLALTRYISPGTNPIGPFFMFQGLFSTIIVPHGPGGWIYVWDSIDIIVFITFFFFVSERKDWRYFTGLFLLALINRESALFIALWMILQPSLAFLRQKKGAVDVKMFIAGLISLFGGFVFISFLRGFLLVREIGPELFHKPELAGKSVHFKFFENIEFFKQAIMGFGWNLDGTILIFILASFLLIIMLAKKNMEKYFALCLCQLSLLLSLILFSVIHEVRIHLELIPFMVFSAFILTEKADRHRFD
jgi:hypothetical protein